MDVIEVGIILYILGMLPSALSCMLMNDLEPKKSTTDTQLLIVCLAWPIISIICMILLLIPKDLRG